MMLKKLIITLISSGCLLLLGCGQQESSFELAHQSRLPHWFALPPGLSRSDVTVVMTYYIKPSERISTFTLLDAKRHKLSEKSGPLIGLEPFRLKNTPAGFPSGYPSYEIVTVNGITEVIEHRQMEPIFYVTDDPAVLNELGVRQAQR